MNMVKYIGLPYKSKGRDFSGVDCWGLITLFYSGELNLVVPSYSEQYKSAEDRATVSQTVIENVKNWKKVEKPEFGDVLVFEILGLPIHTGIYIGGNDFLHAFKNTNSCVERLNSITWERRLIGIYRWIKN